MAIRMTFIIVVSALMLPSCQRGEHAFLTIQFCLSQTNDASALKTELRELARIQNMRFVDGSKETEDFIRSVELNDVALTYPILHVAVESVHGYGLTAGNQSLGADQVAIGFGAGSAPQEARRFAKAAIEQLAQKWRLYRVSSGRGAFPLKHC